MKSVSRLHIVAATVFILTACATPRPAEPVIRTVEVRIPIDDPRCAREAIARLDAERPQYPDTPDALAAVTSVFDGARLLTAGRLLRIAREAALESALRACAAPPVAVPGE